MTIITVFSFYDYIYIFVCAYLEELSFSGSLFWFNLLVPAFQGQFHSIVDHHKPGIFDVLEKVGKKSIREALERFSDFCFPLG